MLLYSVVRALVTLGLFQFFFFYFLEILCSHFAFAYFLLLEAMPMNSTLCVCLYLSFYSVLLIPNQIPGDVKAYDLELILGRPLPLHFLPKDSKLLNSEAILSNQRPFLQKPLYCVYTAHSFSCLDVSVFRLLCIGSEIQDSFNLVGEWE